MCARLLRDRRNLDSDSGVWKISELKHVLRLANTDSSGATEKGELVRTAATGTGANAGTARARRSGSARCWRGGAATTCDLLCSCVVDAQSLCGVARGRGRARTKPGASRFTRFASAPRIERDSSLQGGNAPAAAARPRRTRGARVRAGASVIEERDATFARCSSRSALTC